MQQGRLVVLRVTPVEHVSHFRYGAGRGGGFQTSFPPSALFQRGGRQGAPFVDNLLRRLPMANNVVAQDNAENWRRVMEVR